MIFFFSQIETKWESLPGSLGPKEEVDAKEAFRESKGVAQKSNRSIGLYFHSQRKNTGGFWDRIFFYNDRKYLSK